MSRMFKTISEVSKDVWSDIFFILVIHLLLLCLYAFVCYNIFHFSITSKPQLPQFPLTNASVFGVRI